MHLGPERNVREQRLHHVLAVVERALNGDVTDIGRVHRGHLAALHQAGAPVRVQDDDVDTISTRAGLDGRRPGVAGGGGHDCDAGVAFGQHAIEQASQHLHRHVLERERRAVK